jgi:MoxR-like ATPase
MVTAMNLAPSALATVETAVVGRRRETELVLASLAAGRNVLLEGPPGTGKSTLLRSVASVIGTEFVFVEGNAELTPARLLGSHDPAQVLERGYSADTFVDGPLLTALRAGSLLYVEEINRVPEETLNVLVTVMAEREVHVPRVGIFPAEPGFRMVAAMNPFDAVGTGRISAAIYDRTCRVEMGYQSDADEVDIVAAAVQQAEGDPVEAERTRLTVDLARSTRSHADIRVGSSVRGAIDMELVTQQLAALRSTDVDDLAVSLDAAKTALSGRIRLYEGSGRSADEVVEELWRAAFADRIAEAGADAGKAPPAGKAPTP